MKCSSIPEYPEAPKTAKMQLFERIYKINRPTKYISLNHHISKAAQNRTEVIFDSFQIKIDKTENIKLYFPHSVDTQKYTGEFWQES